MKKRILTLILLLVAATFVAEANPVGLRTAQEVVVKFMNANSKVPLRGAEDLQLVTIYNISRGDAAFYVFNTPNGYVIVSADDCATPILGYSNEGQFDVNNIPIQLQDYLQDFVEQIQYGIENHLEADEQTLQQWELVRTVGRLTNSRSDEVVEPLLTTKWSQSSPYNMYVPNGYPAGCVATAMAQIMKYWEWPVQGVGEHSYQWNDQTLSANFIETIYDWDNMLDSYGSSTQEQKEAVATLMWHCGVAVNMQYAPNSSGASSNDLPSALVNYFGYSDEMSQVYKNNYSDEDWLNLLKSYLDLGCPIHYSGRDTSTGSGHSFVCDGYDANNLLHFNWGWGGYCDGYFSINAMNPSYHDYTSNNMATINIRPGCTSGNTYQITVSTDSTNGGTVSGAGSYDCGEICTLTATAIGEYSFMYWTEEGEPVSSEASYSFIAMNNRNLVAHFGLPFTITASANPAEGGTVSGGGICYYNQHVTLIATANEGYVFDKWTKDGEDFSYYPTLNLTVTEAAEYVAYFQQMNGIVIGDPTNVNYYFPITGNYSLTQQIYTAEEMGGEACEISSVSFFNTVSGGLFNLTLYMVSTSKTAFDGTNDWILVTEANQVFSGSVYMAAKSWTTIYFATPFSYDGSSNVALIVDNNSSTSSMFCRTFKTDEKQAICIYGYDTNYDPYHPSGYTGTLVSWKNQVVFGIPNYDYCVTASAAPNEGGTVSGGGLYYLNQPITLTATPNEGYVFNNWTKDGDVVSYLSTLNLTVTASVEYVAHFQQIGGIVIGDATSINYYLPTNGRYSLSQQIYTAEEMGGEACGISSVSFFNTCDYGLTRNMDVYMVNTDKVSFESNSDWISVSDDDLVFSGSFTFTAQTWATIYFDTPFFYDGSSNVALIVDDNSNSYNSSDIRCRTFETNENQAIYIFGTDTNFDPYHPSGGSLISRKNQIVFHQLRTVTATASPVEGGTVNGGGAYAHGLTCTLTATPNAGYYFLNWTEDGEVVTYDADYSFTVNGDRNLVANFIEGESICTINFDLYDSNSNGWSGNYLVVDYGNGNSEQLTVESGASASFSREIATGSTIALSWITGTSTSQCSFDIKFDNGVLIYHKTGLNSNFQQELYVNCAVASAPCTITAIADPEEGGMVEGVGTYDSGTVITLLATPGFPCTLTATPNEGYLFLHWSKNGEVVSCKATYSFTVTEDTEVNAIFMHIDGRLIGSGEITSSYLPSYSYCRYSLSQQIYTPEEIGEAGSITSISFYNAGSTKSRIYDIYMVHTDKSSFDSNTDWMPVTEVDRVYRGNVTMTKGYWTTLVLDTPFAYDGTSNLAIVVHDNKGSYTESFQMYCRVFNAQGYQAIYDYSDGNIYNPSNPSTYSGTRVSWKNQIILGVMPAYRFVTAGTWGNATNWSGGTLPGANDEVFIDASCQLDMDATVASLTVSNGQSLALQSGKTLTVTNVLTNAATTGLVIEDGAQLVHASENVSAMVKKNIVGHGTNNGKYYLISNPLTTVVDPEMSSVNHLITGDYDLYDWLPNASDHLEWRNFKDNIFLMSPEGFGYLYANRNGVELSFPGILKPSNNRYAKSVSYDSGDTDHPGWNLIGNPFVCNAYLVDEEGTPLPYYRMNATGNGFEAVAPGTPIAPMEGVFYKASGNGTVYFTRIAPSESADKAAKQAKRTVKQNNDDMEHSTLGDLEVLDGLKENLEKQEKAQKGE
jgi:hypothetical protein